MPILFIGTGSILILVGLNGDAGKLYALLAQDFSGPGSFVYWMASILLLGALGYIKGLENLSRLFLVLVLLVLFLDNGGFFTQFQAYLKSTTQQTASSSGTTSAPAQPSSTPSATAGAGG